MGFVAQVNGEELGLCAFLAEGGGGLLAAIFLDVCQDYLGAFGGALAGAAEADALGGAGDQDDFVLETVGHGGKEFTVDSLQLTVKVKINGKNLTQRSLRTQRAQRRSNEVDGLRSIARPDAAAQNLTEEKNKDNAEAQRSLRFAEEGEC